jgi:hypothetical protein
MRTVRLGATLNDFNALESMDERKLPTSTRYSAECTVLAAGGSPK